MKANFEYILFGEDDVFLKKNYTEILFKKIEKNNKIGILSGELRYISEKKVKFNKFVKKNNKFINPISFNINTRYKIQKNFYTIYTHAIFLTKKKYLKKYKIDSYYNKGNGYREETDFQILMYSKGYKVLITSDTTCYSYDKYTTKIGGQRINNLLKFYWNNKYTFYLLDKYYVILKKKFNLPYPKIISKILFFIYTFIELFIYPIIIYLIKLKN